MDNTNLCESCVSAGVDPEPLGKKVSFDKHGYDYLCDGCIDADARAIEVAPNGDFITKTYRVSHEVREETAIGIWQWRMAEVEAINEEEARDVARVQWRKKGYDTRAVRVRELVAE